MGAQDRQARPLSAIPPRTARVIAFASVLIAGLFGGLLGYAMSDAFCDGDCRVINGISLLAGSVITAGGLAVVAVLALRAMGEWHDIRDRERAGHAP